jgi:hypothetical protein
LTKLGPFDAGSIDSQKRWKVVMYSRRWKAKHGEMESGSIPLPNFEEEKVVFLFICNCVTHNKVKEYRELVPKTNSKKKAGLKLVSIKIVKKFG